VLTHSLGTRWKLENVTLT